ncbi:RING finger protein [Clarias magur]|uniref:E3 ubiquitin-protein ligase RNF166 n=1 Tax=Clarias magur TaxID=1594786 RepID=A0A8J4XCJ7_CLAMG|nr:RING finger protein [Clarias magur]
MAMFRSLVSAAQLRQPHPQPQLQHGESLESQFSCPICLEVYHKPVSIASCAHTFCGDCLQPCLQVTSPLCPLCRMPFDPKKVDKSSSVEKQLSSYKAPCRGCSKKITLIKMRSHITSCTKVQEQMANCPKFMPVVPTSQPIPSNIPNRSTFVCPYCGARNLDQQELVKHCMENHRNDPNKVVCPVCSAMPWGDPSYKSSNFLQHLLHRHKFSYDTFVVESRPGGHGGDYRRKARPLGGTECSLRGKAGMMHCIVVQSPTARLHAERERRLMDSDPKRWQRSGDEGESARFWGALSLVRLNYCH